MTASHLRLDGFLPYRLSITSNLVSDTIASAYEALFGLRIPEWRLIAVIAEQPGLTQQEIGVRTRMDKVTVSRSAIALCDRGLLTRKANAADGRSHRLSLTPAGEQLYAQVAPAALEMERRVFASFSTEERETLMALLLRLEAAALDMQRESQEA